MRPFKMHVSQQGNLINTTCVVRAVGVCLTLHFGIHCIIFICHLGFTDILHSVNGMTQTSNGFSSFLSFSLFYFLPPFMLLIYDEQLMHIYTRLLKDANLWSVDLNLLSCVYALQNSVTVIFQAHALASHFSHLFCL